MVKLFTAGKYKVGAHEFELARDVYEHEVIDANDFVSVDGSDDFSNGDAMPNWLGEVVVYGADAEKVSA